MDEHEFKELFDATFDDVWKYARRRCACSQDADDITAETFAVAWRRRDDLPSGAARLWLFGAARRVLANHQRGSRRRERLHERLRVLPADVVVDPADEVGAPPETLAAALRSMPPEERDLLMLRAWDQMAVTDIAELLACTPNAVSIRLTRARSTLRASLAAMKDPVNKRTGMQRTPIAEGEEA